MPFFKYTVKDRKGVISSGTIRGETQEAVRKTLLDMGYIITSIQEESKLSISSMNRIKITSGIKRKDVAIFARQFSTMVNAGLSLTKCLTILGEQTESASLKDIIKEISKGVESGESLSTAMSKHSSTFPPIFISMVRAGELGGVLDDVLLRIADHFEKELALKGKIKSAMTYPIVMLILVTLIMAGMMVFVIPMFQEMFASMGGELPLLTQIMVDISTAIRGPIGILLVLGIAATIFGIKAIIKTPGGRLVFDTILLKSPIIGPIVRKLALTRFSRTLSTLVTAGVPILNALEIVADTSGNAVVSNGVKKATQAVKEGEGISGPLSHVGVFPSMVIQMIAVGEETGALDIMLAKVADFYEEESSSAISGLTSVIEPLMMALIGGIVGIMVVSLYLPMFGVIELMQQ